MKVIKIDGTQKGGPYRGVEDMRIRLELEPNDIKNAVEKYLDEIFKNDESIIIPDADERYGLRIGGELKSLVGSNIELIVEWRL